VIRSFASRAARASRTCRSRRRAGSRGATMSCCRLPRRRWLRAARLSRGRVGAQALRRLPRCGLAPRLRSRAHVLPARLRAEGVDLAGYTLPERGRPRSGTEGARLPPRRPRQRERGHPDGHDLLLAVPAEHPSVGHDRREPAGPLPLGCRGVGRPDPPLRGSLCARRRLPQGNPAAPSRFAPKKAALTSS
jgi:hypothetical protein